MNKIFFCLLLCIFLIYICYKYEKFSIDYNSDKNKIIELKDVIIKNKFYLLINSDSSNDIIRLRFFNNGKFIYEDNKIILGNYTIKQKNVTLNFESQKKETLYLLFQDIDQNCDNTIIFSEFKGEKEDTTQKTYTILKIGNIQSDGSIDYLRDQNNCPSSNIPIDDINIKKPDYPFILGNPLKFNNDNSVDGVPDIEDLKSKYKDDFSKYFSNENYKSFLKLKFVVDELDKSGFFKSTVSNLSYSVSEFVTEEVTIMDSLFKDYIHKNMNFNLSNWNVSNVTNFSNMFNGCESFNGNLSSWRLNSVTGDGMISIFEGCSAFNNGEQPGVSSNPGLKDWFSEVKPANKVNATSFQNLFKGCANFNQNLSSWDVSSVNDFTSCFEGCTKLHLRFLSKWNISGVKDIEKFKNMILNCKFKLKSKIDFDFYSWKFCKPWVDKTDDRYYYPNEYDKEIIKTLLGIKNDAYLPSLCKIYTDQNIKHAVDSATVIDNKYYDSDTLQHISEWDVSEVKIMSNLFKGKSNFNENLSKWDVSKVKNMDNMFKDCTSFNQDLGTWGNKLSTLESMKSMFYGSDNFEGKGLNNWIFENLDGYTEDQNAPAQHLRLRTTGLENIFIGTSINQDLTTWNLCKEKYNYPSKESEYDTLYGSGTEISSNLLPKLCKIYTDDDGQYPIKAAVNAASLIGWIDDQTKVPIKNWDVSGVTDMSGLFMGKSNFNEDLSKWNVSKVKTFENMFAGCSRFNQDLSSWRPGSDTGQSTINMEGMFSMESLFDRGSSYCGENFNKCMNNSFIGEGLTNWNVRKVNNFSKMFYGCNVFNEDLSSWRLNSVTDNGMISMFEGCGAFNNGETSLGNGLNNWFSNANPSNKVKATSFNKLFKGCTSFNQNLSNWNVLSVTDFTSCFDGCSSFIGKGLGNWDVSGVETLENFRNMFNNTSITLGSNIFEVNEEDPIFCKTIEDYPFGDHDKDKVKIKEILGLQKINQNDINQEHLCRYIQYRSDVSDDDNSNIYKAVIFALGSSPPSYKDTQGVHISNWNVSQVINMSDLFNADAQYYKSRNRNVNQELLDNFNVNLSNWDVRKVTNFSSMFYKCEDFNNGNESMEWRLNDDDDISINMFSMFKNCTNFTGKGLGKWNVQRVSNMVSMFSDCENFKEDLSDWTTTNLQVMRNMFQNANNFTGAGLNNWNISKLEGYTHGQESGLYNAVQNSGITIDLSDWNLCKDKYNNPSTNSEYNYIGLPDSYSDNNGPILCKKYTDDDEDNPIKLAVEAAYQANSEWKDPETGQHISTWDVTQVSNMSGLFQGIENFNEDLSDWDVSQVIDFSNMFAGCLNFNNGNQPMTWIINTESPVNMESMFSMESLFDRGSSYCGKNFNNCMNNKFTGEGLTNWKVSNVTNFSKMFFGCKIFNGDLSNWRLNSVTGNGMDAMFENCNTFNNGGYKGQSGDGLNKWFFKSFTDSNGQKFNLTEETVGVTSLNYLFKNCHNFNQDLSNWNVSEVTSMEHTFLGCHTFNKSLGSWDVSNVRNMNGMFANCHNLTGDWLSEWATKINNVDSMTEMFSNTGDGGNPKDPKLFDYEIGLSNWNFCKAKYKYPTSMPSPRDNKALWLNLNSVYIDKKMGPKLCKIYRDHGDNSLKEAVKAAYDTNPKWIDPDTLQPISEWNVSQVINMSDLFSYDRIKDKALNFNENLSNWDVSNVTNFSNMFNGCTNFNNGFILIRMGDLKGKIGKSLDWEINTSGMPVSMAGMFQGCEHFTGDGLQSWGDRTRYVTDFSNMFNGCEKFNQNLSSWRLNSVNGDGMISMFEGCSDFNNGLDAGENPESKDGLNKWVEDVGNTLGVTSFEKLFKGCSSFNQNIGNWNVENVNDFTDCFNGCSNFEGHDLKRWFENNSVSDYSKYNNMFLVCTSLNLNLSQINFCIEKIGRPRELPNGWNFDQLVSPQLCSKKSKTNDTIRKSLIYSTQNDWYDEDSFHISEWDISGVDDLSGLFCVFNFSMPVKIYQNGNWVDSSSSNPFIGPSVYNGKLFMLVDYGFVRASDKRNTKQYEWFNGYTPKQKKKIVEKLVNFDQDLSKWDVSNVKNFTRMFYNCKNDLINIGLNAWGEKVTKVESMESMFSNNSQFNANLNSWKLLSLKSLNYTFYGCSNFDGSAIDNWGQHLGNLENTGYAFFDCENFTDYNIGDWNILKLKNANKMFKGCTSFRGQSLYKWGEKLDSDFFKIKDVNNISDMFKDCINLEANLSTWIFYCIIMESDFTLGKSPFRPDLKSELENPKKKMTMNTYNDTLSYGKERIWTESAEGLFFKIKGTCKTVENKQLPIIVNLILDSYLSEVKQKIEGLKCLVN